MKYKNIEIEKLMIFIYREKEFYLPGDEEISIPPFDFSKDFKITKEGLKELLSEFKKIKETRNDSTIALLLSKTITDEYGTYNIAEIENEEELLSNLSEI